MARSKETISQMVRSAVSNGSVLHLVEIDGRSATARRFRDLVDDFSAQVGDTSPAQLSLIRRVAALSLQCELAEAAMVSGQEYNAELYIRTSNILGGLIARLGLAKPTNTKAGDNAKVIDGHTAALLGDAP